MKKIIATAVTTGLLLAGGAATASAETLYRSGANKVTITAQGAPEGAAVTKAKVTVKKGKKTVARNKDFYKAKKGTYKVTSTVSYYLPGYSVQGPATSVQGPSTQVQGPGTTKSVTPAQSDLMLEKCTVTGRTITNRTVQVDYYSYYYDEGSLKGQAAVTYTGNCTAKVWDENGTLRTLAWTDDWTEVISVSAWVDYMYLPFDVNGWLQTALATNDSDLWLDYVGDEVLYPGDGSELEKAPAYSVTVPGAWTTIPGAWTTVPGAWTTAPATPITTVKTTRTVVVR